MSDFDPLLWIDSVDEELSPEGWMMLTAVGSLCDDFGVARVGEVLNFIKDEPLVDLRDGNHVGCAVKGTNDLIDAGLVAHFNDRLVATFPTNTLEDSRA